jgi:hypothetical protein
VLTRTRKPFILEGGARGSIAEDLHFWEKFFRNGGGSVNSALISNGL